MLVFVLALVAACSKLPDEPRETCGNGVIDPGEDCDGSPGCMQCALTCSSGSCVDASGAPLAGYTGGVDKRCHAPSGAFHAEESGEFAFTPVSEVVTDIDADGIGDVVGVSQDNEVVHFGDAAGLLQRELVSIIPQPTGLPTFAKLDDDASTDLLVPAADGLAAMTSPSHIPLPFPFTNNASTRADCVGMAGRVPRGVVRLDDAHLMIAVADSTKQVYIGILDIEAQSCTEVPACTLQDPGQLGAISITTYDTSAVTNSSSALVVLDDHSSRLCVMSVAQTATTFSITQVYTQAWTPKDPTADRPVLAMLDAVSACPSLVTSGATGLVLRAGVTTAAGCALATTTSALATPPGGPYVPAMRVAIQPQIAGAGPDALVLDSYTGAFAQSSIYAYPAGMPELLYASNDAFSEIASADLDGDGIYELVAAPQLATDLKILYRTQAPDGFLLDRIPTNGTPSHIVLDDYDGNGIADIAYLDGLASGSQLMVAYGTRDRPAAAVPVASFASPVFAVLPIQIPDSIDPGFKTQDLVVLQQSSQSIATAEVTVLHGSAQRTMFAFYDPRAIPAANQTMFANAVGGNFFRETPASDVLVLETPKPGLTAPYPCPVNVWEARGVGGGTLDTPASPLDVCEAGAPAIDYPCGTKLCGSTARFLDYPLADRDVAIGLDYSAHVVTIDPAQAAGGHQPVIASSALASLPPGLVVYRASLADLDGDGQAELIAPYRSPNPTQTTGARVMICAVDGNGVVARCDDLRDLVATGDGGAAMPLAGLDCVDARPGRATPRGRLDALASATVTDLAVTCFGGGGGVFVVSHATGAYVAHRILAYDAYFLDLADVTGDGVDDLLVLSFDMEPTLHIYPQCEARDLACQGPK